MRPGITTLVYAVSGALLVFALSSCSDEVNGGRAHAAAGGCVSAPEWGSFPAPARYEDAGDGRVDTLLGDFAFVDPRGEEWTAHQGLRWDGASIPRVLWAWGSPKTGCYKLASIVHDEHYKHHDRYTKTRQEVDWMFYEACRANGVGRARAETMYYALRWFGERWEPGEDSYASSMPAAEQVQLLSELELYLERAAGGSGGAVSLDEPQRRKLQARELERVRPDQLRAQLPHFELIRGPVLPEERPLPAEGLRVPTSPRDSKQ